MVDQIRTICSAVSVPVIADADTGYGNALHVYRTVKEYERSGLSGLHIEDQDFPKRCGHFDGKQLIPTDEMVTKIRAACDAREDEHFTIIARTDARAVDGVQAAIDRSNAYADAGADMIFPEAPQNEDEMARFCTEIDAPVMANMVEYGKTPQKTAAELEALGFDLVIFPNSLMRAAMETMVDTAAHIKETGTTGDILDDIADFELRNELTDFEWVNSLEERYE
jgi:methylisocitrate lyase